MPPRGHHLRGMKSFGLRHWPLVTAEKLYPHSHHSYNPTSVLQLLSFFVPNLSIMQLLA